MAKKNWLTTTEAGREYKKKYTAKNFDLMRFDTKKGFRELFKSELAKDSLSMQGYLNNCIVDYLKSKGYTDSDLEQIHEQAKKEEL